MGLRFIIGRAGTGKSSYCLREISRQQREDPLGKPLILLVPEQATHYTEMILAHDLGLAGTMRAQVLSFQRLAWRILAETGGSQKMILGEVGKRMILKRLLIEHRLTLRTLAHSAGKPGMADQIAKTIGEFKTYRVKPEQLRQAQIIVPELADKLGDLALLYESFENSLDQDIRDTDDVLRVLAEKIPYAESFKNVRFWIDGFQGFTPQEFEVLRQLMHYAEGIEISLTLDPIFLIQPSVEEKRGPASFTPGEEFFNNPLQTFQELRRLAILSGTPILEPVILSSSKRFSDSMLEHLERSFFAYPISPYSLNPVNQLEDVEDVGHPDFPIEIFAAANLRNEVENTARELRRMARENNWRWRDMAVVSRDLPNYYELISQIFMAYQIPFFLDYKRPAQHHPLIEFIRSVFEIVTTNWAYGPLFRCLKTDFFPLSREHVDRLENFCLAHGFREEDWLQDEPLSYDIVSVYPGCRGQKEVMNRQIKELDQARKIVRDLFYPFVNRLKQKDSFPASMITREIYSLLENLNIPETLTRLCEMERERGNVNEADLHRQIWEAVIQVLDEMAVGLEDQEIKIEDYAAILAAGLENVTLGLIPQGYDQVFIGALERSFIPEVRVLVVLGATEGMFPARPDTAGLLDIKERKRLEKSKIYLAPKGNYEIFTEQSYVYFALTRAKEKLLIFYPLSNEGGQPMGVSPAVARIIKLFPGLCETFCLENDETIEVVSHPLPLLTHFAARMKSAGANQNLPLWTAVEEWLARDPRTRRQYQALCQSMQILNQEKPLTRELAGKLYGNRLRVSVSRMERFASCPFAHFAGFGLRLKERTLLEMSRRQIGDFCHAVLYQLGTGLSRQEKDWGSLSKTEIQAMVEDTAAQLLQDREFLSFRRTAKARYFTRRLQKTVVYTATVLAELARRGEFVPIGMEVKFGPGTDFPGETIPLGENQELVLHGQIDRIDGARIEQRVYLRIMDYKSSPNELSLDQVFHGIHLQLLAYLETAFHGIQASRAAAASGTAAGGESSLENQALEYIPAGFIYFPVIEPKLQADAPLDGSDLEALRSKEIRVRGYLLADREVLIKMDNKISSGNSEILGVKINKSASFTGQTKVLTEEEFGILRNYLHFWMKKSGRRMLAGEIGITPFRQGNKSSCQYCNYKMVCHFDPSLPENMFRALAKFKDEEALERMRQQLDGAENFSTPDPAAAFDQRLSQGAYPDVNWLGDEKTVEEGGASSHGSQKVDN